MHRDRVGASPSDLAICLAIEGVERFFWFWWFQTLPARSDVALGFLLLLTYLLPAILAPAVARVGTGRCVAVGAFLYCLAFGVSVPRPGIGIWLVVVASAVHKTSLIPTASRIESLRSFPALLVAVNLAGGLSALLFSYVDTHSGLKTADTLAACSFGVCGLLGLRLHRVTREDTPAPRRRTYGLLAWSALAQLPLWVAYWAYMTQHRRELEPLFVRAGFPKGALLAVLCVAVLALGLILSRRSSEHRLRDGRSVLLWSSVIWFFFYAVAGLTLRYFGHLGATSPKLLSVVLLTEATLGFAAAEAISGAVASRLLLEAAPTRPSGSAAYFVVLGLGSLLAKFLCDYFSGAGLLLALALITLVSCALIWLGGDAPGLDSPERAANLGGSHG